MARRTGDRAGFGLRLAAFGVVGFLYFPLAIIILYAFNTQSALFTFPPPGLTTRWFEVALSNPSLWASLRLSVVVAAIAMWMSFYFTVPFALLDWIYCGVYLGHGAAFLRLYWYLTAFYFIPWALWLPMSLGRSVSE